MSNPARYEFIPVDSVIPSPYQARKAFNEDALAGLAASMQQEGLIEPIVVRQLGEPSHLGPTLELISGERRLRAARLLGWETIEAKIITTVSEGEAAAKGLVENLQPENLNAVEEAEGFAELQRVDPEYWNQERIAQTVGKTQGYISQSLQLLTLAEEIQDNIRRLILSRSHGLELLRLPTPELQLTVAREIPDRLTVKETRLLVNNVLNPKDISKLNPIISPDLEPTNEADPLVDLWTTLQNDPRIAPQGTWGVSYGSHPLPGKSSTAAWQFWIASPSATPKADLARWFRRMAEVFGDSSEEERKMKARIERWMPQNDAERAQLQAEQKNLRLPGDSDEQAELETLALQGPFPFYAWIYGNESVTARKMRSISWDELEVPDPVQMARTLVSRLRKIQSLEAGRN